MDYLDTKKELRHHILLMIGYLLIGMAIVMATLILLHQAYGFGLGKNGDVIQNGLTFFSSQPSPADIYVDGKRQPVTTNTRLPLPAGVYQIKLTRDGYRDWQRTINLEGGSVQHYDYPFLFPEKLSTTRVQSFTAAPGFMTQSPDRRWLLIQPPATLTDFIVYDLKNPDEAPLPLTLPANLLSPGSNQAWQLVEWSADNRRVLLQHNFDGQTEYVIVDRLRPAESFNVNTTLGVAPSRLTLRDKKYDRYFIYDAPTASLKTISLEDRQAVEVLRNVLTYKTYGDDTVLFTTNDKAPPGKTLVKMIDLDNSEALTVRSLPASPHYLLDLTKYSGAMYVAAGTVTDKRVFIYKDPAAVQPADQPTQTPSPQQVLHVENPSYLSFSSSAQFIVAENGNRFGVYDNENEVGFNYTAPAPIDSPQAHAHWMDGNRLLYVSGGKLTVFDYDNLNQQTLMPMSPGYLPAFTPDYEDVLAIAPSTTVPGQYDLTITALLTAADQ